MPDAPKVPGRRRRALWALVAAAPFASAQDHAGQYEQADVEHGARLYAGHCITCHGERGDAMPGAELRSGRFRNAATDRELSALIRDGIPGTAMVASAYSEPEIAALVAYLRNMASVELGALRHGDAERGRALFTGDGDCDRCHRVDGGGPRFAPDLSRIGATRTAAAIERSIVDPDAGLQPINRPVRIVMADGSVISGRRLNEDTFTVQLIDANERLLSLDKSRFREYSVGTSATMPAYGDVLDEQQVADLVAYLLSLKGGRP